MEKANLSLLVIHTGKRTIKLNWFLHNPQSGSHIKEKEPRLGITCKKQIKTCNKLSLAGKWSREKKMGSPMLPNYSAQIFKSDLQEVANLTDLHSNFLPPTKVLGNDLGPIIFNLILTWRHHLKAFASTYPEGISEKQGDWPVLLAIVLPFKVIFFVVYTLPEFIWFLVYTCMYQHGWYSGHIVFMPAQDPFPFFY